MHCYRFLILHLGPEGGILIRHSPSQGSLHFGTQCQFAQVLALLWRGLVSLLLEALALEAVEAGGPFLDLF